MPAPWGKSGRDASKTERCVYASHHGGHRPRDRACQAGRGTGDATVIAVGGDGTVNEVAAGLNETETALGIIPAGNGNDFAKALGIPKAWDAALEYLLKTAPHRVDTGKANDRFFINICGTGFDVMVLENMLKAKEYIHGKLPYLYGIFVTLTRFKPLPMRIETAEGVVIDKLCSHFSIANGQYFGSGIRIMPLSAVDDGVFDIMVIDKMSRWKIFLSLPSLLKGTIINKTFSHHYRTKECTLSAPGMHLNLDGEIVATDHVKFTCLPASLLVHKTEALADRQESSGAQRSDYC